MKKSLFGLSENVASALSYAGLFVTGLIVFVLERDNKTVRFHALQSTVLFGVLFVLRFVCGLFLGWIPLLGGLIVAIPNLLIIVSWLFLTFTAYKGVVFKVPVLGDTVWAQVHKE